MNNVGLILLIVVLAIGFLAAFLVVVINLLKKQIREEIKFNQDQFLQLAQQQFETQQSKSTAELDQRKQSVESSVSGLKEELERYQRLMREFEQDRAKKYGSLENELKNASTATVKLQETTNHLNNILGNVKLRGQWGERMAEDIIQYAGLLEGVNYRKQTKLDLTNTIPDYTFLLPDNHKVNMDVKFPYDKYIKMMNAPESLEKEHYQKEFSGNVTSRIRELRNRGYINPQENTLDFVLLFIPSEQVYAFIQEQMPGIMDEALKQKVVLCSPFTLYAMLTVIRQAYENFRYEKDMKKIIDLIDQFAKLYENFKVRFEDIGKSLEKMEATYNNIKLNNFKQLDTKIRQIDEHKKGNTIPLNSSGAIIDVSKESLDDQAVV